MQETVWNSRVNDIRKSIEGLQGLFDARGECIQRLSREIEELEKQVKYLEKELEETCRTKELDLKNHNKRDMALVDELAGKNDEIKKLKEENNNLKAQNERLKTEVKEALAKRDYYQDLANKEAADAEKVKQDCEKEMEWQRNKLQEFDYVLTKYRAKIKELEGRFELDEKSQLAILAGACAIRGHKHFDDGAYCNIAANGIIGWKYAEQVLMNMITKE